MVINLDNNISSTFRQAFIDIIQFNVSQVIFKGGRSSFKSAVAAMGVIVGVMVNNVSALCIVKTDSSSQDKLANNFKKYMELLGISHKFRYVKSNQRFVLLDKNGRPTRHVIRIKGANNVDDLKSMTTDEPGGYGYTFVEEATLFLKESDLNSLFSTAMRGSLPHHLFIIAYNPPMETDNYLNERYGSYPCGVDLGFDSAYYYEDTEIKSPEGYVTRYKVLIHHSSYLDAIRDGCAGWLGNEIIAEYEKQRECNHRAWEWDKLGKVIGTDANIFWNIHDWKYTDKINIRVINRGLDCSNGGHDPWFYIEVYYDKYNKDLYILNEFTCGGGVSYEGVRDGVKSINKLSHSFYIDGAVPTHTSQLRSLGLNPLPAKKAPDSIKAGIVWLMSLNHIYIDPVRCPKAYKEFKGYRWVIDKYGEITNKPIDKDNHSIDACRYALSYEIRYE